MLHQPASVPTRTGVATGYAPRRSYLAYFALVPTPRLFQNIYHVRKKEGILRYMVNRPKGYKRFKTQPSKERSQETQSRDDFFIASQEIQTTMKDLRHSTRVQPQRGTNNKGQSKSVHPSHFEPEAVDNKNHPSEIRVAKRIWTTYRTK